MLSSQLRTFHFGSRFKDFVVVRLEFPTPTNSRSQAWTFDSRLDFRFSQHSHERRKTTQEYFRGDCEWTSTSNCSLTQTFSQFSCLFLLLPRAVSGKYFSYQVSLSLTFQIENFEFSARGVWGCSEICSPSRNWFTLEPRRYRKTTKQDDFNVCLGLFLLDRRVFSFLLVASMSAQKLKAKCMENIFCETSHDSTCLLSFATQSEEENFMLGFLCSPRAFCSLPYSLAHVGCGSSEWAKTLEDWKGGSPYVPSKQMDSRSVVNVHAPEFADGTRWAQGKHRSMLRQERD